MNKFVSKLKVIAILIAVLFTFNGCEKIFLGPDPGSSADKNFQIFWQDFDRYYAQFQIRHIDWDSVYNKYMTQISASSTDEQLYKILSDIVTGLNDMHVNLFTALGETGRNSIIPSAYPSMRFINPCKYIKCGQPQNSVLEYRNCLNTDIGYLAIHSFDGQGEDMSLFDERYNKIDEILSKWKDKKGIIIDLRWNGGGNFVNAESVAGRFTDNTHVYSRYREKTGPAKDAFSSWQVRTIVPKGDIQYLGPVVILISRFTASSAELFTLAMRSLPNVILVGDTTGGGVGAPVYREIPNGWTYRLSTRYYADMNGRIIEGSGIFPDIPVLTTAADSANGIDRIFEKGLELLTVFK